MDNNPSNAYDRIGAVEHPLGNLGIRDHTLERLDLMEEKMKRLLSGKEKDDCDSKDKLKPFTPNIAAATYPVGFRMPHLSKFDGNGDPSDQLGMFNTMMMAHNVGLNLRCILFPTTLVEQPGNGTSNIRGIP